MLELILKSMAYIVTLPIFAFSVLWFCDASFSGMILEPIERALKQKEFSKWRRFTIWLMMNLVAAILLGMSILVFRWVMVTPMILR